MPYTVIIIVAALVLLLIVGGKPLLRKRLYKDFVVYAVLLSWATFIAVSITMEWNIASQGTSVSLVNTVMSPINGMMKGMSSLAGD